jgi:hypothetical protein
MVQQLKVTLTNKSGLSDDKVFLGFVGGSGSELEAVNLADGKPLSLSQYMSPNWYPLSALKSGIGMTKFIGGRVYVCYDAPWTFARAGYEPSPVNPTDPDYLKRYDKMEMTYTGTEYDVADTTSIDFFSIPMELYISKGGKPAGSVTASATDKVVAALGAITSPAKAAIVNDAGKLVRVIGPGVYPPPPGLPASPYDDFESYLRYLQGTYAKGGVIAAIKGRFAGVGPNPTTPETKPQDYDFTASIDAALNITLKGSATVVGAHTLLFKKSDLVAPSGIYGANPNFSVDGKSTHPLNDVYGWIAGDLLSGLNIGAVGSTVTPAGADKAVGEMESQQWFKLKEYFGALQPAMTGNYNRWAATMAPLSQAYNFAYSDRFAHVVATLNPAVVDTLEIVILGDK